MSSPIGNRSGYHQIGSGSDSEPTFNITKANGLITHLETGLKPEDRNHGLEINSLTYDSHNTLRDDDVDPTKGIKYKDGPMKTWHKIANFIGGIINKTFFIEITDESRHKLTVNFSSLKNQISIIDGKNLKASNIYNSMLESEIFLQNVRNSARGSM